MYLHFGEIGATFRKYDMRSSSFPTDPVLWNLSVLNESTTFALKALLILEAI